MDWSGAGLSVVLMDGSVLRKDFKNGFGLLLRTKPRTNRMTFRTGSFSTQEAVDHFGVGGRE
jgi:hypothetical protein